MLMQPAFSQDSINPDPAPNAEEQIEDLLGQKKEAQKKPQTLLGYADAYNQRCLKIKHPILGGKDLKRYCSCVSLNIPNAMTLQQMKDAQYKTSEGYFQRTRLLMFAYAPCIEKPLYRMIFNDCYNNVRNKAFMKNVYGACDCIANDVSEKMYAASNSYIRYAIKNKQSLINPLDILIRPDGFEQQMRHKTKVCLSVHERIY